MLKLNILSGFGGGVSGALVQATFGYFIGGHSSDSKTVTDKLTFATGVVAVETDIVTSNAGSNFWDISDTVTYGYHNKPADVERLTFASDTLALNTDSDTSSSNNDHCGFSDANDTAGFGYWMGGERPADSPSLVCDRITFSTSVTAVNTDSDLSVARALASCLSDRTTFGYTIAGFSVGGTRLTSTDKTTFSTSVTAAETDSDLSSVAGQSATGVSDNGSFGFGYYVGGVSVGNNEIVTAERMTFSTGVFALNTDSNLDVGKQRQRPASDNTEFGYLFCGITNIVSVATSDRITFSSGVNAAHTDADGTTVNQSPGGMSDGAV